MEDPLIESLKAIPAERLKETILAYMAQAHLLSATEVFAEIVSFEQHTR